ncbi:MAG TPA: hypothetical protein EYP43_04025 [Thermoplasmata archaeon]|nr:hypothetical protein [Thermoplasmata archaeon]
MKVKVIAILIVLALLTAPVTVYYVTSGGDEGEESVSLSINGVTDGETVEGDVDLSFACSPRGGILHLLVDGQAVYIGSATAWTWDTALWDDGDHTLTAIYDVGDRSTRTTITVTVDNRGFSPPSVAITAPTAGLHAAVPGIIFTVEDLDGDLEEILLIIDGEPHVILPSNGTTYTWPVALDDGEHEVVLTASDGEGLEDDTSITFTLDSTPPALTLRPHGGWHRPPVTLRWTVEDAHDVVSTRLSVDGEEVPSGTEPRYVLDGDDGLHEVLLEATDAAGNVGTLTATIGLDATPPVATLDMVEGQVVGGVVTVTGNLSDGQAIARSWLLLDGDEEASALPFDLDTTLYAEGPHILILGCEDRAGNSAGETVNLTFDNTPPDVDLNLTDGAYLAGIVAVTGTAEDANGIDAASLRVDGDPVAGHLPFMLDTRHYPDGPHVIDWSVEDAAGNPASVSVGVRFDNTPPAVGLDLVEGEHVRGTLEIDGEAHDSEGVNRTYLLVDGEEVADTLPYDLDTTTLDDGPLAIRWGCEDVAGNVAETIVHVYVDNTPPDLEVIVPDGILRGAIPVVLDVEDNLELAWYGFIVDGETPEMAEGYLNTSAYDDGEHVIQARAVDAAGNERYVNLTLTFDNTPPTVSFLSPAGEYVRGIVDVTLDAEDEHGIAACTVALDGEHLLDGTNGTLDTAGLDDGGHELRATVEDVAGNVATCNITFTVDNTPPEIGDVEPENGSRVRGEVTISFDPADASPVVDTAILVAGVRESNGTSWTWNSTTHEDGWTDITLMAEDAAGNIGWCNLSVLVDNVEPPVVYVEWPVEGMALRGVFDLTINVTYDVNVTETRLRVDGEVIGTYDGLRTEFTVDTGNFSDGHHALNVTIEDEDANVNWTMVNLTFDNTPPDASWSRPYGERVWNVTLEVDASDATTSVEWIAILVNGTEIANGTADAATWPDGTPDGPYTIEAYVADRVGNVRHIARDVWLDLRPPAVGFVSPQNDSILRRTIQVWAVHEDHDIEEVHIYLNDETVADAYSWVWDTTGYDDGEYWLNLTAIDRYDNQTHLSLHLGVDNTPPEMGFLGPAGYYIGGMTDIEADVFDVYGVDRVAFLLDGVEVMNGTGQVWGWNTTTSPEGDHNVTIVGIDRAGNWNTTWRHWYVDNEPPEVSIGEPEEDAVVNGTVNITVDATDNVEVERVLVYVNTGLIAHLTAEPWATTWDTDGYADGNYTISAVALDPAGNTAIAVVNVTKGERREVVVTEPTVKVLSEYDLFGVERIVLTESRYQGTPVVSTLMPHGITPSIEWQCNAATDEWINYTSLSEFSSRIAISVWSSPERAIVVDDYSSALLAVPISVLLDAPVLVYGQTTDEALWRLGTVHADQILVVGNTPYNTKGVTVIPDDEAMEYALGAAHLAGENPAYIVVTNPDDLIDGDANTRYLSAFAGAYAAHYRGVVLEVTASSSGINQAVHDAYDLFDAYGLTAEYLCIVGDYKSVPHVYENHGFGSQPSDNRYADLDDNPTTIEVAVGRVFGKDLADMSYYLDRVVNYAEYLDTTTAPAAPAPLLVPGQWNNNAVIYMGWAAEFAEDSENHCREYMRNIGWFNTKDDTEVAHAMATAQLMADFALSNFIVINADHGMPTGTVTFSSSDLQDLNPSVAFGVSCSVGRTDGVDKDASLTYTFLEKGANAWLAPTRTAYGSFVQTYPYQPIAAPGLCYLYLRALIDDDLTSGEALMKAKNDLIQQADSNVNRGTNWQYVHYGDPGFNPYEPCNEGWWV